MDFDRDCLIYEICNPQQAKKVLEANPVISTALPCRVSLYSEGALVNLAMIRPTALLGMFNTPQLKAVAEEHAKGRRLMIATTNLDTEQAMIWDMGAIASRDLNSADEGL